MMPFMKQFRLKRALYLEFIHCYLYPYCTGQVQNQGARETHTTSPSLAWVGRREICQQIMQTATAVNCLLPCSFDYFFFYPSCMTITIYFLFNLFDSRCEPFNLELISFFSSKKIYIIFFNIVYRLFLLLTSFRISFKHLWACSLYLPCVLASFKK